MEIVMRSEPGVVAEIAWNEAGALVWQGFRVYDDALAGKVKAINGDPRKR